MSPKRKHPESPPTRSRKSKPPFSSRDGLSAYTAHPETYPPTVVIFHNPDFVAIHDLYPKSSVHMLLLPRSEKHTLLHPFEAFEDAEFLAQCREQAGRLKKIAAKELQRLHGRYSRLDAPREAVLNGDVDLGEGQEIPTGRDWEKEIRVGIHAVPSMNHLHIHVISVDRFSECVKHRKHYNSFATGFFVPLEDFPLAHNDKRRHPDREGYLNADLKCWRCGQNYGNKFTKLKEHLEDEFKEWRKE
jgi:aprataxin